DRRTEGRFEGRQDQPGNAGVQLAEECADADGTDDEPRVPAGGRHTREWWRLVEQRPETHRSTGDHRSVLPKRPSRKLVDPSARLMDRRAAAQHWPRISRADATSTFRDRGRGVGS